MLGLAESVIFPIAELQPLRRKAFRWHSLTGQTAWMYRSDLLSCGIAPVGKSPLTTTAIEPDVIRVCSVSGVPERERTADDHSRSDHWEPCHHRHIEQTTPLGLTCQQHQCRQGDASVGPQVSWYAFDGEAGDPRREIIAADPLRPTPRHHENGARIGLLAAGACRLSCRSRYCLLDNNADQRHCDHRQNRLGVEINHGFLLRKDGRL